MKHLLREMQAENAPFWGFAAYANRETGETETLALHLHRDRDHKLIITKRELTAAEKPETVPFVFDPKWGGIIRDVQLQCQIACVEPVRGGAALVLNEGYYRSHVKATLDL